MVRLVTVLERHVCKVCGGSGTLDNGQACEACDGTGAIEVEVVR